MITVCGNANKVCPAFTGKVEHRIHLGFDDPGHAKGDDAFKWSEFQRVRDEIKEAFFQLYVQKIKPQF